MDATHPFAETMTASAAAPRELAGVPLLRLQRPGWTAQPGDDWRWVDSLEDAAAAVAGFDRVFLTTGRQGLGAFAGLTAHCIVRSVDPPEPPLPARTTVVLERGPFSLDDERALLREHAVQVVVTKDSGGHMTEAKLAAARELGLPVVLVRRPPLPPGVPTVATVEEALAWLSAPLSRGRSRGVQTRAAVAAADPGLRGADDQQAPHVDRLRVELAQRRDGELLLGPADVAADDHHGVGRAVLQQHLLRLAELVRRGASTAGCRGRSPGRRPPRAAAGRRRRPTA